MNTASSKNTSSLTTRRTEDQNLPAYNESNESNFFKTVAKGFFAGNKRSEKRQDSDEYGLDDKNDSDENDPADDQKDFAANTSSSGHLSENFSNETDLLINCIGYSVGLGNLWRFPYLAYKNGGGAFIIPYVILTFIISIPLYYMELLIGQSSKLNSSSVWSLCPVFKGIGVSLLICILVIQVYYNVIMAYAMFYLLQTFQRVLPWSKCFEWWGADESCYEEGVILCKAYLSVHANCSNATESSSDQFFRVYVLQLSSALDDIGTIKWDLALLLLASWIIVCAFVIGRHHTKFEIPFKTIYVTAFLPFILLMVYFCYTVTLPGAGNGLRKLFIPNWSSLLNINVWSEAAQSSIFSTGIGTGGLIVFGSKADYHSRTFRCAFVSCMVDTFASILAATVTFMVVGFLAETFHLQFSEATLSDKSSTIDYSVITVSILSICVTVCGLLGQGLVFVTFPNAVLKMSISHLWAFLFFCMLLFLALDTSIATTEAFATGFYTLFFNSSRHIKSIVILSSIFFFLAGLTCVTNGGAYFLNILDYYGGGFSIMGTVLMESIAYGWGYGVKQASRDIVKLQGSEPGFLLKLCWAALTPFSLILMFLYSLSDSRLGPLYNIPYPAYADVIGWIIVVSVLLPVPIWMVIVLLQHRKNIRQAFEPEEVWKNAVQQVENDNA